jgi:hypothetical protein
MDSTTVDEKVVTMADQLDVVRVALRVARTGSVWAWSKVALSVVLSVDYLVCY